MLLFHTSRARRGQARREPNSRPPPRPTASDAPRAPPLSFRSLSPPPPGDREGLVQHAVHARRSAQASGAGSPPRGRWSATDRGAGAAPFFSAFRGRRMARAASKPSISGMVAVHQGRGSVAPRGLASPPTALHRQAAIPPPPCRAAMPEPRLKRLGRPTFAVDRGLSSATRIPAPREKQRHSPQAPAGPRRAPGLKEAGSAAPGRAPHLRERGGLRARPATSLAPSGPGRSSASGEVPPASRSPAASPCAHRVSAAKPPAPAGAPGGPARCEDVGGSAGCRDESRIACRPLRRSPVCGAKARGAICPCRERLPRRPAARRR